MRRYETIVIVDPDTSEEEHTSILNKMDDLISQHNGLLIEVENWGVKKTAYEIKKKSRGHYIKFDFCSEVTMVREMEYFFGINDSIIKFMTIVLEKRVNIQAIKNTLAEAKQSETENNDSETPENETVKVEEEE